MSDDYRYDCEFDHHICVWKDEITGGVPDVPKCLYGGIRIPQLYGLWLVQN